MTQADIKRLHGKDVDSPNDNLHAIRSFQKRGFEWVGFYKDSVNESRKRKPEIPKFGEDDIPIKHEIEFERRI